MNYRYYITNISLCLGTWNWNESVYFQRLVSSLQKWKCRLCNRWYFGVDQLFSISIIILWPKRRVSSWILPHKWHPSLVTHLFWHICFTKEGCHCQERSSWILDVTSIIIEIEWQAGLLQSFSHVSFYTNVSPFEPIQCTKLLYPHKTAKATKSIKKNKNR